MTILIDADGCPVVDITIACAAAHQVPVLLVCDNTHHFAREGAVTITVGKGADSVDFALVNRVQRDDIVITQDYGLAAMALARQAHVLSQNGLRYTDANIDALLMQRHTARKLRMAGSHVKGPAKRTSVQDEAFRQALTALIVERQTAPSN